MNKEEVKERVLQVINAFKDIEGDDHEVIFFITGKENERCSLMLHTEADGLIQLMSKIREKLTEDQFDTLVYIAKTSKSKMEDENG